MDAPINISSFVKLIIILTLELFRIYFFNSVFLIKHDTGIIEVTKPFSYIISNYFKIKFISV